MKRTQHYRMKNQLWRRAFVAILVVIVLCVCSLYVIQHKPTTLKSEPKAVKHTAKPASESIIKNLNQNVLLKNNNLADSFNTQLKDSGFIGTAQNGWAAPPAGRPAG